MPDYGHRYADKKLSEVDRKLERTYKQAQRELKQKLASFNKRFEEQNRKMRRDVMEGKISKQDYKDWLAGRVFVQQIWKDKINQVTAVLNDHNNQSVKLINESRLDVFAENYNYQAYVAEKQIMASFTLYNAEAVARLMTSDPDVLPKWNVDKEKDYKWNTQKVNNIITQGIIQGESIPHITERLCNDLCTQNKNRMRMFARTAITGAENAGRQEQMNNASAMGIKVHKRWEATHDSRTRDSHRSIDGEEVPYDEEFSNGLEYPGDPSGDPEEVYNCRCTMVSIYPDYEKSEASKQDSAEIDSQDYDEWKDSGKSKGKEDDEEKQLRDYEKIWGDIVDERGWSEFSSTLNASQREAIQNILNHNNRKMSPDLYWRALSDGLYIDERINRIIMDAQNNKHRVTEEKYESPLKNNWLSSKYSASHAAINSATTSQDVAKALSDAGVFTSKKKVNLNRLDVSNAKEIAHTYLDMVERYPWMKRKVSYIEGKKLEQNTNAQYSEEKKITETSLTKKITFNSATYSKKQEAHTVTAAGMYHPIGTGGLASTTRHEFAHGMVYEIARKERKDPDVVAKTIVDRAFSKFGMPNTTGNVKYNLSGYAAESDHELIAEACSEYHSSSSPRDLARCVMDELISEAKGAGLK